MTRLFILAVCAAAGLALFAQHARTAPPTLVFVSNQDAGTVSIIDASTDKIVSTLKVSPGPANISIAPDNRRVYVAHPEAGKITMIDAATRQIARVFDAPGTPFGLAADRRGRLFVGDWHRNVVSMIDARSGALLKEAAVGKSPAALALDPSGSRLYVANRESHSVSVLSAATLSLSATVSVGLAPFSLAFDQAGERLYVANAQGATLSVIDANRNAVVATLKVGGMPYGVAVLPGASGALVANQQSGTVSVVNADLEVSNGPRFAQHPEGIALHPEGRKAYVANWFSGEISVIDAATGRELKRIPTGEGARAVAIAGG